LVSNGLRCPFKKDKEPVEYGVLVEEYLEAVYELKMSPIGLHDAMSGLIRTWKYARWPTIGELLEILKPPQHVGTAQLMAKPAPVKWADEVMRLPEGQTALAEGFGRELYLWAERNNGIVPSAAVMDECKFGDDKFRITLRKQIDRVRNTSHGRGDGNLAPLSDAVLLDAAGKMEGFESKLRNEFLRD